jgi:hypothetical protein
LSVRYHTGTSAGFRRVSQHKRFNCFNRFHEAREFASRLFGSNTQINCGVKLAGMNQGCRAAGGCMVVFTCLRWEGRLCKGAKKNGTFISVMGLTSLTCNCTAFYAGLNYSREHGGTPFHRISRFFVSVGNRCHSRSSLRLKRQLLSVKLNSMNSNTRPGSRANFVGRFSTFEYLRICASSPKFHASIGLPTTPATEWGEPRQRGFLNVRHRGFCIS